MTKYVEPIYDRTEADIVARNTKAHFNISDWVRIYGNSLIVAAVVEFFTGETITPTTLTEPEITTFPTADEINTFIENIEISRDASGFPVTSLMPVLKVDWAEGAGSDSPDFEDVNDWERILATLMNEFERFTYFKVYCGVATTGQFRFYQNRWRVVIGGAPEISPPFVQIPRVNVGDCGQSLLRQNGFRRYA